MIHLFIIKFAFFSESPVNSDESVSCQSSSMGVPPYLSSSNPDLTTGGFEETRAEFPDHVLKVKFVEFKSS